MEIRIGRSPLWRIVASAEAAQCNTQVLHLGEINDTQQQAWRRTLEVFDEDQGHYRELSLFPHDRPLPADELDSISVKLNEIELRRPACVRRLLAGMLAVGEAGSIVFLEDAANRLSRRGAQ